MKVNENFSKLKPNYIFSEIKNSVSQKAKTSKDKIIDLGIGDVKLPLFKSTVDAMKNACDEMLDKNTFKGYSPAQGYSFLREKIAYEYSLLGADVSPDEIFITDGAKGQLGQIAELFSKGLNVLFLTPCYPAGAESNILLGNNVTYLKGIMENGFIPTPPYGKTFDLIYICSPNNPTGATFSFEDWNIWINYALSIGAVIICDGAYSSFISGNYPKSVYQHPKAKDCVIEINSFSKSLGFTGIRCGFNVIPRKLTNLNDLFNRRIGCTFNGVSYISQKGAESLFSKDGKAEIKKRINFYKTNAEILKIALKNLNLWYNNTVCAPYVFAKAPKGVCSREFCSLLLDKLSIVATPGDGFLDGGEGFFRLSAFSSRDEILTASDRLNTLKQSDIFS